MTKTVLNCTYTVWKFRNKEIHGTNKQEEYEKKERTTDKTDRKIIEEKNCKEYVEVYVCDNEGMKRQNDREIKC